MAIILWLLTLDMGAQPCRQDWQQLLPLSPALCATVEKRTRQSRPSFDTRAWTDLATSHTNWPFDADGQRTCRDTKRGKRGAVSTCPNGLSPC